MYTEHEIKVIEYKTNDFVIASPGDNDTPFPLGVSNEEVSSEDK